MRGLIVFGVPIVVAIVFAVGAGIVVGNLLVMTGVVR